MSKNASKKKEFSPKLRDELLAALQARFEAGEQLLTQVRQF